MPGPLPAEFLTAVCEAFPIASPAAHEQALQTLAQQDDGQLDKTTKTLADALELWIRPRARGRSLEDLRLICARAWFDGAPDRVSLTDYVITLARRHLTLRGAIPALRTNPEPAAPIAQFRWLSLLPPDLLVAALAADSGIEPASDHIDLSTPQLASVLESPVAETHLHVGAAVSFGLLWTGLMATLAHQPPDPKALDRGAPVPFGDGRQFATLLQAAAITRLLLGTFLWQHELRGTPRTFAEFFLPNTHHGLDSIAEQATSPPDRAAFVRACVAAVRAALTGKTSLSPAALASVHRRLLGPRRPPALSSIQNLLRADPLADWLIPAKNVAPPETRFSARALRYLRGPGRLDHEFARTFWQYQRLRAITYRHLTFEPGTAGLDWFQTHYNRISAFRKTCDGARFEAALRLGAHGARLASLETRTAPEPAWHQIRDLVRQAAIAHVDDANRPEIGLVLHFLKQSDQKLGKARRLHADPTHLAHGCRFGAYAYARLRETLAIETALTNLPELLLILRGIDVASTEIAVPTWAIAPFFRRVRSASHLASVALSRSRPEWRVPPLRATFHAGEHFYRLVEGLRRMHELLEFELIGAGDRIGHGLAAGIGAKRWAKDHPVSVQPAEERLEDLLWEIDRYEHGHIKANATRVETARAEARRLALELYGRPVEIADLIEARRRRHDPKVLARLGYPFLRALVPECPIDRLVHQHLTHAGLFRRGQRPVEVQTTDDEVRLLSAAARWLRQEISRRGITIEANPSSNMLIGDLLAFEHHPAFRFQPIKDKHRDNEQPIHLSINTDDPITFATSTADEFAYLYGALLREDIASDKAIAWLERRRDDGWRSRFTLARSADAGAVRELLCSEAMSGRPRI